MALWPDGDAPDGVPPPNAARLPPGRQLGPVEGDGPGVPQVEHRQHEAGGEAEEELGEDHAKHGHLRDDQQRLEDRGDQRHGTGDHYNMLDRVTELAPRPTVSEFDLDYDVCDANDTDGEGKYDFRH